MSSLVNPAYREHVMLLYDSDDERNAAAAHYINEGLKGGQLCVYASVGAFDSSSPWHTSSISSRIIDYDESVKNGNLVVVDFKPFFESAQRGDLAPFWQLRSQLETMLKQRTAEGRGDRMLIFADAACALSENKEFDECVALESWWQGTHREWVIGSVNVTVICPHPGGALDLHSKERIGAAHSLTLHLKHYKPERMGVRALIAESNPDMQYLYRRYLDKAGFDVTIVGSGRECLDRVFGNSGFEVVVLDSRFEDMTGFQIARRIKERLPDQKIIVTTTSTEDVDGKHGMDTITKPFSLSKLVAMISKAVISGIDAAHCGQINHASSVACQPCNTTHRVLSAR